MAARALLQLVIWAVDLAVEDKHELKERVAHQAIIAQYIMELARTLKRDPRSCVDAFFTRISTAEEQYMTAFNEEFQALLKRIDGRKVARLEEAKKQVEAEEVRIGTGLILPLSSAADRAVCVHGPVPGVVCTVAIGCVCSTTRADRNGTASPTLLPRAAIRRDGRRDGLNCRSSPHLTAPHRTSLTSLQAEEREQRLGPAGLDPLEVIDLIPKKMKEAFETQNTPMLKESFAELPPDEMDRIYNMVVGSGLWVPQGEPEAAEEE